MHLTNHFRARSDSGEPIFGVFSVITDPAVVELIALAGFDFVGVEMEHGPHSITGLENHHRAASACGLGTIVKLPVDDRHLLLKVLETGVDAVLLASSPDVATLTAAVQACRFPPVGSRGVSTIVRGAGYSSAGMSPEVLAERNRGLVVGVLVENPAMVEEIEQVAAVPDIDFLFIGTADLALAMGVGAASTQEDLAAAIDRVIAECAGSGRVLGMPTDHPAYPKSASELASLGARVIISGSDVAALLAGLRAVRSSITGS